MAADIGEPFCFLRGQQVFFVFIPCHFSISLEGVRCVSDLGLFDTFILLKDNRSLSLIEYTLTNSHEYQRKNPKVYCFPHVSNKLTSPVATRGGQALCPPLYKGGQPKRTTYRLRLSPSLCRPYPGCCTQPLHRHVR